MIWLYCQVCECDRVFTRIGEDGNMTKCVRCGHVRILTQEQMQQLEERISFDTNEQEAE